jgi:hypothetical protein
MIQTIIASITILFLVIIPLIGVILSINFVLSLKSIKKAMEDLMKD